MKNIFFKILFFHLLIIVLYIPTASAQDDEDIDVNQDAEYDRPFIKLGSSNIAIGGYTEGNTNYFVEDGVTEGFSMELRRFNVFFYAPIHSRLKFLSELEFEHGTEEIALETAQLDFEFSQALHFRGGIIIPKIGLVNDNHDSPKWDFVERPLTSTDIIPSTLSEVGFGIQGKFFPGKNVLTYDAYITNGLNQDIILNSEGKTFIPSGKSEEMFKEDNNGVPMMNAKVSLANRKYGEIGVSYYGGTYNSFRAEGAVVDSIKRNLSILAVDITTGTKRLTIKGEGVLALIDIPSSIIPLYGDQQMGGFLEANLVVMEKNFMRFDESLISINARLEWIDLNVGTFAQTNQPIGDEITRISAGISWRPTGSTVIRTVYSYQWEKDVLGNPPALTGGIQFGIASYF